MDAVSSRRDLAWSWDRCAICIACNLGTNATRIWQEDIHLPMRTSTEGAKQGTPPNEFVSVSDKGSLGLLNLVLERLDDAKAENTVKIDLAGKSSIGDFMVVTSGRSHRHVGAIADQLVRALKDHGFGSAKVEGLPACDWVLIDTGDVIVHIFRPEVREFYNLEKMWSTERPSDPISV